MQNEISITKKTNDSVYIVYLDYGEAHFGRVTEEIETLDGCRDQRRECQALTATQSRVRGLSRLVGWVLQLSESADEQIQEAEDVHRWIIYHYYVWGVDFNSRDKVGMPK